MRSPAREHPSPGTSVYVQAGRARTRTSSSPRLSGANKAVRCVVCCVLSCSVSRTLDWAAASSEIAARHGRSWRSASQHIPGGWELRDWPTKSCRRSLARAAGTTEGQRALPGQLWLWLAEGRAAPRVSAIARCMALKDQLKRPGANGELDLARRVAGDRGSMATAAALQRCSVAQSLEAALLQRAAA